MRKSTLALVVVVALACQQSPAPQPQPSPRNLTGVLGAATYEIDVPGTWNGTLFLYSHGYVAPGGGNRAQSAPAFARKWLLDRHFAAAGSAYSTTGWAVEDALKDQMALLDFFARNVGKPTRVIAWGHSLGGLITAGLIQLHPDRFAAAMPMCGVLSGSIATWNVELDSTYAFKTLLAPQSQLELVHITDGFAELDLAQKVLTAAQQTPPGQARLALVAAVADLPGWFSPAQPEPAADDYAGQGAAQWLWISPTGFGYAFPGRLELEQRAGGNPSWNVGVDYGALLAASVDRAEVEALYAKAGLDLQQDIRTLNAGTRIKADPAAAAYLDRNLSLDGNLSVPVMSMHTTGDGLVIAANEAAYSRAVASTGKQDMLRQVFVHRAGHCTFTAAETIAALQVLLKRLDSGQWDDSALQPAPLNAAALAQGSANQLFGIPFDPSFVSYTPASYPRPFFKGSAVPA